MYISETLKVPEVFVLLIPKPHEESSAMVHVALVNGSFVITAVLKVLKFVPKLPIAVSL